MMHGTVTVTGLTVGASYTVYRWDSVESGEWVCTAPTVSDYSCTSCILLFVPPVPTTRPPAFDYGNPSASTRHVFTASSATYTFADPVGIISNGVTYYRCLAN